MCDRNDPGAGQPISADDLVSAVLAGSVAAMQVFVRRRMACPGCAMAPYVTLAEAAACYGLDARQLVNELNAAMNRQHLNGPEA